MTNRRLNTMGKKPVTHVDSAALAELQAASIEARIRRGLPLTKQQEAWWNAELATALQKRHALRGYVARSRLLSRALVDDRLSVQMLAMKVLEVIDDRLLGRPQAIEPHHGGVTVIFGGGLDPNRLPDAGTVPPNQKLLKEGNGKVVPPKAVNPPTLNPADPEES